ncbi:MAG: hypothetical protein C4290_09600, partial [Chloroflexota bacterium]
MRIVILERSPEMSESLVRQLQQAGYAVEWWRMDCKEQFLAVFNPTPDVILADNQLPDPTALEVLDLLQARGLDVPVNIIAERIGEARAVEVIQRGAANYLPRDHLERLGRAVAHTMERRWTRRAKAQADALIHFQAQLLNAVGQAAVATTLDGTIVYWNRAAEQLYGWRTEEVLGRPVNSVLPAEAGAELAARLEPLRRAGTWSGELPVRHRDGSWRHLEAVITNLLHEPNVRGIVVNARDVTKHARSEQQLAHRAFSDELTGLPNRALFMDRLSQALPQTSQTSQTEPDARPSSLGVFVVDLDGFKLVNGSLGHGAGDMLLAAVARRLARQVQPGDTLARFGDDQFAVLARGITSETDAYQLARQVVEALHQPFDLSGQEVFATVSIG